ncbi:branched-chain amino acid ABC transporter substrate-binding protein [Aurantimonas sp. Leaf443]|uniref:branched-chain amino acid ABC transporter substrate-binding protein n=1 Tax=Aurantimonas sp. Leaf443 TaxID=1736378 RepID=UPI0006F6125D|nr:branched-chain amino acid ABC transporter substrate-binding protein [Aurantimonas sp. Leaf443]KQT86268.1 amino acid ABC transporter substrate-binding protein [Aurantimonas sp. Leaf443]
MRNLLFLSLVVAQVAGLPAAPALGQDRGAPAAIGIAAPLEGAQALLGRQIADGVRAAAARLGPDAVPRLVEADTACTAEGGRAAAERFVAEKVEIVVGFLCSEEIEAALPILQAAGIPTLNVGVRANRLTDERARTGHLVWRVAPRSDAEASALARTIVARWTDQPFGLVEDGSIEARTLVDTVRRLLSEQGLQPSILETFRPAEEKQFGLVRRLQRSGVTRFLVVGERPDVATIARDAASNGLALEIVGGEKLFDEGDPALPLPAGTIAVGPKNRFPELRPAGTPEDPDAAEPGPYGYYGPAFAATEIALQTIGQARDLDRPLPEILSGATFRTVLGPIRFDAKGDSTLDLYRAFRWEDERFTEAGAS